MTNPPDVRERDPGLVRLEADLDDLYAAPVPSLAFVVPERAVSATPARPLLRRHWRPLAAAAAAIVVAVGAIVFPGGAGAPTDASAAEILDRPSHAAASWNGAAADLQSYHRITRWETRDLHTGGPVTTTEETWYGGPGRISQASQRTGPLGPKFDFLHVTNGEVSWMRDALALPAPLVLRGPGDSLDPFFVPAVTGSDSVADALASILLIPECHDVVDRGESTYLGRPVYMVDVLIDPEGCEQHGGVAAQMILSVLSGNGFGATTVLVDRETYLPLRFERRDGDGNVTYLHEVTLFETNIDIPDAQFTYTPAPGETVVDVADLDEATQALVENRRAAQP